mmetsp:Transcript_70124/g.195037  ORF Transcript_70124/g.195037 Transcript_70124/m.195037 type:complete len:269 (+) Transcript_70124:117-923(+)
MMMMMPTRSQGRFPATAPIAMPWRPQQECQPRCSTSPLRTASSHARVGPTPSNMSVKIWSTNRTVSCEASWMEFHKSNHTASYAWFPSMNTKSKAISLNRGSISAESPTRRMCVLPRCSATRETTSFSNGRVYSWLPRSSESNTEPVGAASRSAVALWPALKPIWHIRMPLAIWQALCPYVLPTKLLKKSSCSGAQCPSIISRERPISCNFNSSIIRPWLGGNGLMRGASFTLNACKRTANAISSSSAGRFSRASTSSMGQACGSAAG